MKSKSHKIFLVEQDQDFGKKISYFMGMNPDYQVTMFSDPEECLNKLKENPDLITTAYNLSGSNGLDFMKKVHEIDQNLPVIFISSQRDVKIAVEMLKSGASDYLTKAELSSEYLLDSVKRVLSDRIYQTKSNVALSEAIPDQHQFRKVLISHDEAMDKVYRLMEKGCQSEVIVMIHGETGTGKELVASNIHQYSAYKKGPFVIVNCNAIAGELAESELFGHEKGAFTGASDTRIGKFEEAENGTIFFDEIGDLDLEVQAKLLRVYQEREVTRLGGNTVVKVNCRIIIATAKNLKDEVKRGNFREDLFYRLKGLTINLPPLRKRGNDIMVLAEHFLQEYCDKNNMGKMQITEGAGNALVDYLWFGNVRELRTTMERAAVLCDTNQITTKLLDFDTPSPDELFFTEEHTMDEYKHKIFHMFLQRYDHNVDLVAKKLKIGRATAFRMLKKKVV